MPPPTEARLAVEGSGAYLRPWGVSRPFRVSRTYAGLDTGPNVRRH